MLNYATHSSAVFFPVPLIALLMFYIGKQGAVVQMKMVWNLITVQNNYNQLIYYDQAFM